MKVRGTPNELLDNYPTVSIVEAQEILGLSRAMVYSLLVDGRVKTVRIGSRVMIPTEEIKRLISPTD